MGNATLTFVKTAAFADGMATLFPCFFTPARRLVTYRRAAVSDEALEKNDGVRMQE